MDSIKSRGRHYISAILLVLVGVWFDQFTKTLAVDHLKGQEPFILLKNVFQFEYLDNHGAAFGILFLVFGHEFLSLFATEEAVIHAGRERLYVMSFSYAISAFMDCSIAASRGIGKSIPPTHIVILGSCVFRVIWVFTIFAHFHTLTSLYLLYFFSWAIPGVAAVLYFWRSYRTLV